MDVSNEKQIHLGLLIPKMKKRKIKLPERIQELCNQENIKITEVDVFGDLEEQGPFDVFFHKVVDLHKEELGYEETERLIQKVVDYAKRHPNMPIIDDFEIVRKLMNRKFQFQLLTKCTMTVDGIEVYVPKSLEIAEGTSREECCKLVADTDMKFPVLAKPMASCLKGAHDITVVFNIDNLKDIPIPCLLQEFCNHGGVIYKVFVLGDRVSMCERPSIQDINCSAKKSLVFDTRDVSKTGTPFIPDVHGTDPNLRTWLSCDEKPDLLNQKVITALHKKIGELTKMKVYGLDILINKGGDYAIVDLNHFPGFTGIKENIFVENVVAMIKQCARK